MRNFSFRDDSSHTNLELYRKIEDLEGRLQYYQGLVDDYEIKLMEADYGLKDAEVNELNTRINGLLEENSILKEKLSTFENDINSLNIVESKNKIIQDLEERLAYEINKSEQLSEKLRLLESLNANEVDCPNTSTRKGRPRKYEEYYQLIYYLYIKLKSIQAVVNEMNNYGVNISYQMTHKIIREKSNKIS